MNNSKVKMKSDIGHKIKKNLNVENKTNIQNIT